MKIRIKTIERKHALFFLSYGIFMIFTVLNTSMYSQYISNRFYSAVFLFCLILLSLYEISINRIVTKKTFFALIICAALFFSIGFFNGALLGSLALIPIFIYTGKNIKFESICRFTVVITGYLVVFIILSSYLGVIQNYVVHSQTGRIRQFLGFRYPLYPSAFIFNLTAIKLYLKKDRIKIAECAGLAIINYWTFIKTDSRLSFFLSIILIFIMIFMKYKVIKIEKSRIFWIFICSSFFACFMMSILCVYCYGRNETWAVQLNNMVGNRIMYAYNAVITNGISLLGKKISWIGFGLTKSGELASNVGATYNYVDNMYFQLLISYGIIITLIYLFVFTYTVFCCKKTNDIYAGIILCFFAIHSIIDDLNLYLYYNTFYFLISAVLFQRKDCLKSLEKNVF